MLKKMTSSDSMTTSAENKKGRAGVLQFVASMPLSGKLLFLVTIALIPRIIAFLQPQIITIDGTLYVKMAKLFLEGKYTGIPNTYFNFYPLILFFVYKLSGNWELSGQLISMALGSLTVVPIFLLGRSLYNEKVGWLSALFYISLPNFIKFDVEVLRDPTYWFFMAFSLYLVWEGIRKNQLILLSLASISAGLGALTRIDGIIPWGILASYALFGKGLNISQKRRVLNVTVLIFVFPILLSPVLFSMKKFSSQKAMNEMVSYPFDILKDKTRMILHPIDPINTMGQRTYDSLPVLSQDSLELASRHRFVLAISEVAYKFIKSANLLIILILFGFWKRKKEGLGSPDWYMLYAIATLSLMSVLYARHTYYFSTRHGLTLVLPCLFFAGHGLVFIAEIVSRELNRFSSRWTAIRKYPLHLLTIFLIIIFLAHGLSFKRTSKFIQKEIGLWLKGNGYQGSVIMGPDKFLRLAFYADGKFLEMPDSWEKVMKSIHKNGVKVIVVDSCTIDQDCPGFLANWPQAGLFPLSGPAGQEEKCPIQIYSIR